MSKVMQAVRIHQYGGNEVVQIEAIRVPEPEANEVLVRVHAAGVNPVDWFTREGSLRALTAVPMTLGWDIAGEVVAVGTEISDVKVGEAVYGMALVRGGAFAEYATLKRQEVSAKPVSLDFVQAASIPLVAATAWQALFDAANISAGQRVLIHAAAGGVGTFAVQLAKERQAYVIGTASSSNENYVRELGADRFIDYRSTRFEDVVHNVDVVLDTIGGDTRERSYGVIKQGGLYISVVGDAPQEAAQRYSIRLQTIHVERNANHLEEITQLIDSGRLKTLVSHIFPLSDVRQALDLSHTGHVRGKIVLKI